MGPGSLTPRLSEEVAHWGAWLPFRQAARRVERFRRVTLSEGTVRGRTEEAGAVLVREQEAEVERLEREGLPSPGGEKILLMSVDGSRVPLLKGEGGEVKTVRIGRVEAALRKGESTVVTRDVSSFSRLTDAETFGRQALGEWHRRGVGEAERGVAVNDGAEWIQGFIDYHQPGAVRILDFAHAAQPISGIGHALYGEGSKEGADWEQRFWKRMKRDEPEEWLKALKTFVQAVPEKAVIAENLAYLEKRAGQMRYALYPEAGWPIGSGTVESGNKLIVEFRLKGSGMRWSRDHVNPLLALRNAVCSDRWEEAFIPIQKRQRLERRERKQQRRQERQNAQKEERKRRLPKAPSEIPLQAASPPGSPFASLSVRPKRQRLDPHPWRQHNPGYLSRP